MKNLVGQTVRISPQDKSRGGNNTRTVKIIYEFHDDDNVRWYNVQEEDKNFAANADIYDHLFLRTRDKILPKRTKDVIHNTSNVNYKK